VQENIDTAYCIKEISEAEVTLVRDSESDVFEGNCFLYDIVLKKHYITTFSDLSNLKKAVVKMNEELESDPRNIKCYVLHDSNTENIIDEEKYEYLISKYDYADKFTKKEDEVIYIDRTKAIKMILVNLGIKLDNIKEVLIEDLYFDGEHKIEVNNL
jgi:hypothetical protein